MSTGTSGSDEKIGGTKIEPLAAEVKNNTPLDTSSRGATGTYQNVSLVLLASKPGQYQHTAPHADSHGVVGTDETIQGSKLEPLERQGHEATEKSGGINDESVDTARIEPVGSVREEIV
ncbi:hypothetical protein MMC18_001535 [Xylographa bjoerkii]|nr:hypothetical protein [Xylographa bjoerkii]